MPFASLRDAKGTYTALGQEQTGLRGKPTLHDLACKLVIESHPVSRRKINLAQFSYYSWIGVFDRTSSCCTAATKLRTEYWKRFSRIMAEQSSAAARADMKKSLHWCRTILDRVRCRTENDRVWMKTM